MQHSLRLQNYTVPTWPLMVHITVCFVRSNLKCASGSKVPRTKHGVKSCEKKIWHNLNAGYVLLQNKECQAQWRQLSYSPFNTGTLSGTGVQLCQQTIFPSYMRFLSFLPSFVSYFLHVSLFFSVSPFPSPILTLVIPFLFSLAVHLLR